MFAGKKSIGVIDASFKLSSLALLLMIAKMG
jgi:hypothetical protein